MLTPAEIVTFDDAPAPKGLDGWVAGATPGKDIAVVDPDPGWPRLYEEIAGRIARSLGSRALRLDHVGSTSVPGLAAKPIIDIDLIVADSAAEQDYVPELESLGFELVIRQPWWYEHRAFRMADPRSNVHVFGPDSAEAARHLIFRDWLRENTADRELYAATKRQSAADSNAAGEHVMQYNARKQQVVRDIYRRAFIAAGLLED
jgi:GrpB-like predicted nucleotidyltransferase (UPF0157 family)